MGFFEEREYSSSGFFHKLFPGLVITRMCILNVHECLGGMDSGVGVKGGTTLTG